MALEAWARLQNEAGQPFGNVLAAVLNGANTTAAYLLLAVDLVLSHGPISRDAAVPFLGRLELLCVDR